MRILLLFVLVSVIISCKKNDDTGTDGLVNPWIFNDSIQFNSPLENFVVDELTNTLYIDRLTYIDYNSSVVKINDEGWSQVGISVGSSFYGMALYKNNLFVAGSDLMFGGIAYHRLLYWDGNNWNVGMEPGGWGRALEIHNNELYFGSDGLHKWDDSTWTTLSSEYGDTPTKLYSDDKQLLGIVGNHLSRWDFNLNEWIRISDVTPCQIRSVLIVDDEIFIGTIFSMSINNVINGIAKFDGDQWYDISYNFTPDSSSVVATGEVNDLVFYNGNIYAAINMLKRFVNTNFEIEYKPAYIVARLIDNRWEQVGSEFSDKIYVLVEYNKELYAGGEFEGRLAKLGMH